MYIILVLLITVATSEFYMPPIIVTILSQGTLLIFAIRKKLSV